MFFNYFVNIIEGNLKVKFLDTWKAEVRRVRREKIRRKKMQMPEKVGRSRKTVFFQWFVAPEGRKVGSLKRRVRSQLARWEIKICTPVVARITLPSQNVQNTSGPDRFWKLRYRKSAHRCGTKHISKSKCIKYTRFDQIRTTFGSWDVEKVHAVVARNIFPSQNIQKAPGSDHFWKLRCRKVHAVVARSTFPNQNVLNASGPDRFWKLRCRKSAHRCGTKHISKSKCTKHTRFGPLLEVEMSKKCTPLWREAHFQVKSVKNWRSRTTFGDSDVEKVSKKSTLLWREAHFEIKSVKNWGF